MKITKPIRNTFHLFSLFLAIFPFLCLSSHVPFSYNLPQIRRSSQLCFAPSTPCSSLSLISLD